MAKTIALINNKGGCSKTTSTTTMAEILAKKGYKTLIIDNDPQGNTSMKYGRFEKDSTYVIRGIEAAEIPNVAEIYNYRYRTKEDVKATIQNTSIENLDIIPASKRHEMTENRIILNQSGNNKNILKRAIRAISDEYDYIFIDNNPSSGNLMLNAIYAADKILIPVGCDTYSKASIEVILTIIEEFKDEYEIEVNFEGAFMTNADKRTNATKKNMESLKNLLGDKALNTVIWRDTKISESNTDLIPITEYAPKTHAIEDYTKLLEEIGIR